MRPAAFGKRWTDRVQRTGPTRVGRATCSTPCAKDVQQRQGQELPPLQARRGQCGRGCRDTPAPRQRREETVQAEDTGRREEKRRFVAGRELSARPVLAFLFEWCHGVTAKPLSPLAFMIAS